MKFSKRKTFFPESLGLLFCISLILTSGHLHAIENADKDRFEKIFKSYEMESVEKNKFKLSSLSSEVIIVNFWASWCIPCIHELPSLIAASNKFSKNQLTVVAINTDEDNQLQNISKIKKKLNFPESFIIVPDKKFKIADEFKFSAIPVTVIFKNGKVIHFYNGPVDFLKVPLDLR